MSRVTNDVDTIGHPLSQPAQVFTKLQSAMAASERVFEFLAAEEMADEKEIFNGYCYT